jgi:hypothetical protein
MKAWPTPEQHRFLVSSSGKQKKQSSKNKRSGRRETIKRTTKKKKKKGSTKRKKKKGTTKKKKKKKGTTKKKKMTTKKRQALGWQAVVLNAANDDLDDEERRRKRKELRKELRKQTRQDLGDAEVDFDLTNSRVGERRRGGGLQEKDGVFYVDGKEVDVDLVYDKSKRKTNERENEQREEEVEYLGFHEERPKEYIDLTKDNYNKKVVIDLTGDNQPLVCPPGESFFWDRIGKKMRCQTDLTLGKQKPKSNQNPIMRKSQGESAKKKSIKKKSIKKKSIKKKSIKKNSIKKNSIKKNSIKNKRGKKQNHMLSLLQNKTASKNNSRFLDTVINFPSLTLSHKNYVLAVSKALRRYQWKIPGLVSSCNTPFKISPTQDFIRHYVTPRNPLKGILLVVDTGGGKTCAAVGLAVNFKRVIWVTQGRQNYNGVFKSIFADLCSGITREWKAMGRTVPSDIADKLLMLKAHGNEWIMPTTYRRFSNAVKLGSVTPLALTLVRTSPRGREDILSEAVVIFDESHLMVDHLKLNLVHRPNMKYIEDALERSFSVSGDLSVKSVLLSATPAEDASVLFKQLNLLIPRSSGKFPTTMAEILKRYQKNGRVSPQGKELFLSKTKGLISYLHSTNDKTKFAQVKRMPPITVVLSKVVTKPIQACLANNLRYPGKCIQKKLNFTELTLTDFFDKPRFNPKSLWNKLPSISPRFFALYNKIKSLDQTDKQRNGHTFKHIIFSDVRNGFGAKAIASGLIASGHYNMIIKSNGSSLYVDTTPVNNKTNITVLTTAGLYKKSGGGSSHMTNKILNQIIGADTGVFNSKENNHGKLCQLLILNDDFSTGIDVFDVKYLHIFNPQVTQTNTTQIEGRGTRFCGSKNLKFVKGQGWVLQVYTYIGELDAKQKQKFKVNSTLQLIKENLTGFDIKAESFNNDMRNLAFTSSVDYLLNSAINTGKLTSF